MKKITIIVLTLLTIGNFAFSQDSSTNGSSGYFGPQRGDISVAVLFGRGNFLNAGLTVPSAPTPSWTVPGSAPYANTVDPNENPVTNIVGAEIRYFLSGNLALKLSGGAIMRNTPSQANVPGYIDPSTPNSGWIPAYASVEADNRLDANVNLGLEKHFTTRYIRLFPYLGVTVPFYYARRTLYDPTIIYPDPTAPDPDDQVTVDVGTRSAEIVGLGGQLVAGVDYYLMEGLYFGFELKPVSYVYAYSNKVAAPGLESAKADNSTISFFSQTFIKLGFRF